MKDRRMIDCFRADGMAVKRVLITCKCGEDLLCRNDVNTCACGRDYGMSGQQYAPRSQWGEETGETAADIMQGWDPDHEIVSIDREDD